MAEPSGAAASVAGASELDVLLATKLHVPGLRPGLVGRPRLAEALAEGLGYGLVLVCAPAGYGKTVLLADWVRHGDRPVAWLSLDAGDNDPARFWRHAVAALDRVCPGIGRRAGPLLGPPAPPSFEPLVTVLVNELAAQAGDDEALLILDDYHVIGAEPVHASVRFLLEHRPPQLRLILASRADPPLAAGLVTLAWIRQATGDPAGARDSIGEAAHASPGPAGLLNPVPAQRARLLLAQGDVAGAARWTAEHGLTADDEPDYPREPGHLVQARVLLAQDRPGQALQLLDRLHTAAWSILAVARVADWTRPMMPTSELAQTA
jgi:MalT-like TPR region